MHHAVVVSMLFAAACGSSSSKPKPPAPTAWKDMNHEQRTEYMKAVVLPKAQAVFAAFDPKYATMDCATCHGPGAEDGSFEMPNAKIRPLPDSEEAFMELIGKDAEVQKFTPFMAEKVVPMMAELLQEQAFDPKTKTGDMSCSACHTLVDASGKVVPPERPQHEHHH